MPDFVLPTTDDWDRISKTVREAESQRAGRKEDRKTHPPMHHDVVVKVTGDRFAITTTTGTTRTTTTGTSTTTTTSTSSTSTTTTTTTISNKYLYAGKIVYRRFGNISDQHWWTEGTAVYIQEVNNQELVAGNEYLAHFIGTYGGLGVFACQASDSIGDMELCDITGAPTTVDEIDFYPAIVKRLDQNGGGLGVIGWVTKVSVWLAQRYNYPLSVGFAAMSKRVPAENGLQTLTISSDTRMVYYTSELEWCPPATTTTSTTTTTTSSTAGTTTTTVA